MEQKFLGRQQFSHGLTSFFLGLPEKWGLAMGKLLSCLGFFSMADYGPTSTRYKSLP